VDRGGRTNLGVTEGTLARARRDGIADAENVDSLTRDVAAAIYRAYYWKACGCEELPAPLDLAVFDASVHMGPSAASRQIQRTLNLLGAEPPLAEDGLIGPRTLEAARSLPEKLETPGCSRRPGRPLRGPVGHRSEVGFPETVPRGLAKPP